jgi:hypothetical protein
VVRALFTWLRYVSFLSGIARRIFHMCGITIDGGEGLFLHQISHYRYRSNVSSSDTVISHGGSMLIIMPITFILRSIAVCKFS